MTKRLWLGVMVAAMVCAMIVVFIAAYIPIIRSKLKNNDVTITSDDVNVTVFTTMGP